MRVCAEPGCPELTVNSRCPAHGRLKERKRGTPTQRGYGSTPWRGTTWAKHSAQRIAEEGMCSICSSTEDLTTDHPTDEVWCRSDHDRIEAQRRAGVA